MDFLVLDRKNYRPAMVYSKRSQARSLEWEQPRRWGGQPVPPSFTARQPSPQPQKSRYGK